MANVACAYSKSVIIIVIGVSILIILQSLCIILLLPKSAWEIFTNN